MGSNRDDSQITWVSRAELAKKLGLSRRRIGQLVKKNLFREVEGKGIDLHHALGAYQEGTDQAKREAYKLRKTATAKPTQKTEPPRPPKPVSAPAPTNEPTEQPEIGADGQQRFNFNDARARKENYNAERARLQAEEMAGKLVSREDIAAREFAIGRKLRDRLLGFPAKLANFVPPEAMKVITGEIDALVNEIADDIDRIVKVNS